MPFDGLVTHAIAKESSELLTNAKVDKIFQPLTDEILLHIRSNRSTYKLVLSANPVNARMHLTNCSYENPSKPFNFCMVLRKYLTNSRIKNIYQISNDRIIRLDFEASNELKDKKIYSIIIEIMGKYSNIIFLNDNNIIIDSIKHIDFEISRVREVMPGRPYKLPETQNKKNPFNTSIAAFQNDITVQEISLAKFVTTNFLGISTIFANEIEAKKLNLIKEISKEISPCIMCENDKLKDFYIYPITHKDYTYKYFDNISSAIDFYFQNIISSQKITSSKSQLLSIVNSALSKLSKKLIILNEKIDSVENVENLKIQGELLSANLYQLKENSSNITLFNYYENKDVNIPLDINLTPAENLKKIFKNYHKQKNTLNACSSQKETLLQNIEYYENLAYEIETSESFDELSEIKSELVNTENNPTTKHTLKSQPLKFIFNGFDIFVGKNNIQNEYVTFKVADKSDYWFHVKNSPGSHTILRLNGKKVDDGVLYYAATLAAKHSKLQSSYTADVDYTQAKNVKKIPGAKPGMVTYTNFKTISVRLSD